ncbi:MAG: hypothetical protein ACYC36_13460 [Bellilinea sp.]
MVIIIQVCTHRFEIPGGIRFKKRIEQVLPGLVERAMVVYAAPRDALLGYNENHPAVAGFTEPQRNLA